MKIFLNFTYLHKTQPGQKTAGNFPDILKESIRQMFGYRDLDAGLNTSRFLKVIAFPKPMRHSTLNNRDSRLKTMAITIVIVLTTIPRAANIYVSNCSCYCPSTAVSLVQDSMPLRFLCELKKFASVSSHVSSHMAILLRNFCIILLFAFMAWFEISSEIERRFYQEALSPDLKWRKQGLASLGRCCLIENAISPPNSEVFKPASKSGYPNIWCVNIFKKIWKVPAVFYPGCVL